ncbi:MAG: hypothetical protein V7L20_19870 [Nostoc sp.]
MTNGNMKALVQICSANVEETVDRTHLSLGITKNQKENNVRISVSLTRS